MTLESTEVLASKASAADYLERAKSLAPLIESEAANTESGGTLSRVVVDALSDAGLYWIFVPKEFGGGDVDVETAIAIVEEIARADGSTGWSYMVNTVSTVISGTNVTADVFEEFYGVPNDKKVITAGFGGPIGTATKVDGGYMVRAKRLPFGSGSLHARKITCTLRVVDDEGNPVLLDNGMPDMRIGFFDPEKIIFHGNWDVMGLKGTGSVDYELPEQFIEDKYITSTDEAAKRKDEILKFGLWGATFLGHTGFGLGVMKRALEELSNIVDGKRRGMLPVPVGEYPVFLYEYAQQEAKYQSARAFAMKVYSDAAAHAAAAELTPDAEITRAMSELDMARLGQVSSYIAVVAAEVVNFCYLWAGSEPIRNSSVLGRALRDIRVASNHFVVDPTSFVDQAGPILKSWQKKD